MQGYKLQLDAACRSSRSKLMRKPIRFKFHACGLPIWPRHARVKTAGPGALETNFGSSRSTFDLRSNKRKLLAIIYR